jgi:hypothetical protein
MGYGIQATFGLGLEPRCHINVFESDTEQTISHESETSLPLADRRLVNNRIKYTPLHLIETRNANP